MRIAKSIAACLLPLVIAITPAKADAGRDLLDDMVGNWEGAGKLTYTKDWTFDFRCKIEGRPGVVETQVDLLGKCWAGPIWSSMGAALRYNPKTRSYVGKFRDGTDTFVIDIKGRHENRALDLDLRQGKQRGAMAVAFRNHDSIDLTIAIVHPTTKARRQVVGLSLERSNSRMGALEK
ncbi:MAG: hypothetical protein KDJ77_06985 [Rhodobiaceae bacterium]|nr:hypothetical protein [Rhodobiaceae bacterium]